MGKGVTCPNHRECLIGMHELERALDHQFSNLCQKAILEAVRTEKSVKGCWTPDCPAYFFIEPSQASHQCISCGEEFCLIHLQDGNKELGPHQPHQGTDCSQYDPLENEAKLRECIWEKGKEITSKELKERKEREELVLRRCPRDNCNNLIEHRDACMHMTCHC